MGELGRLAPKSERIRNVMTKSVVVFEVRVLKRLTGHGKRPETKLAVSDAKG